MSGIYHHHYSTSIHNSIFTLPLHPVLGSTPLFHCKYVHINACQFLSISLQINSLPFHYLKTHLQSTQFIPIAVPNYASHYVTFAMHSNVVTMQCFIFHNFTLPLHLSAQPCRYSTSPYIAIRINAIAAPLLEIALLYFKRRYTA